MTRSRDLADLADGDFAGTWTVDGLTVDGDVTLTGANYNVVWDKSDNALEFANNAKAVFGTGSELNIYADGSRSIIQDNGTGNLRIQANNLELNNADNSENYIFAAADGAVTLYHNNSERVATTSYGTEVTATDGGVAAVRIRRTDVTNSDVDLRTGGGTDGKAFDIHVNQASRMRITSAGNVGIGTSSPNTTLTLSDGTDEFDFGVTTNVLTIKTVTSDGSDDQRIIIDAGNGGLSSTRGAYVALSGNEASSEAGKAIYQMGNVTGASHVFRKAGGNDAVTIDSSGDVLVAKTSNSFGTVGAAFGSAGSNNMTRDQDPPLGLNRLGNDGGILSLFKDSSSVGNIATVGGLIQFGQGNANLKFSNASDVISPANESGTNNDNALDLGTSSARFKDLYLAGGIQFDSRSNKLDDYEEGTWTPVITPEGGSAAGITVNHASYTKIGQMVFVQFDVKITSISGTSSSNAIELTGLPFARSTTAAGGPNIGYTNINALGGGNLALQGNSTTKYRIVNLNLTTGDNASDHLAVNTFLRGQFSYNA